MTTPDKQIGQVRYWESEWPPAWRDMLQQIAPRLGVAGSTEPWILRAANLPQSLPDHPDRNLLERLIWTLVGRPDAPAVFHPLYVTLRKDQPLHVMACDRAAGRAFKDSGWVALFRTKGAGGTLAMLPSGSILGEEVGGGKTLHGGSGRASVLAFSRSLLEEREALDLTDHAHEGWPARIARWVRDHGDSPWAGTVRERTEGILQAGRGLRRALGPLRRNEWEPARQQHWDPAFFRAEPCPAPPDGRIHVWMALHWLELGGAEGFAIDLIQHLPRERYAVHVTTETPSWNPWEARLAGHVEEIIHLPSFLADGARDSFLDYFVVSRGIRILHIHHSTVAYSALFCLRRFHPELAVLDTLHILEMSRHRGGMPELSARNCEPFIDLHHVSTRYLARFLRERWHVPDAKIRQIYTNVDPHRFDPDRVAPGAYRARTGIPAAARLVAFIGRFHAQKRPLVFIEMARLLQERQAAHGGRPFFFVMDGCGAMEIKLRQAVRRAGMGKTILFPGMSEDIASLLRDTDVVVLPSENEGLALIAFEAMSMGVPVVCTRVQAQEELVPTELLVEPDADPAAGLADKTWGLLAHDARRQELGRELRKTILEKHRAEETFAAMQTLYESLGPKA